MSDHANGDDADDLHEANDFVPILTPTVDISPRLKTLAAHFVCKYNVEPSFFARVPGRVNLIGEHIDYCGYAVCPMAIEQDILVAVAVSNDNDIHLTNVDPVYKDFRCSFEDVGSRISDSDSGPAWYKYFLCGVKGALEVIPTESVPSGILAAVWGNIPPNSGVSSSSALVSAALLSIVHASQMIAKKRNMDWELVRRLFDIQECLIYDLDEMVDVVKMNLHEEPYTLDEICEALNTNYEQLKETSLIGPVNASQTFKLYQRALHVFQEANRVLEFCRINDEDGIKEHEKLQQLGSLMSESHASLHKLYECSHPNVDALVEKAIHCGAFGARLTGAGWGGCIVAIISKNEVERFVNALRIYLCQNSTKDEAELKDMVFPTAPNQGAVIYTVSTLL
ncbi:N-acetylgalactosamine kinase-like isoform X2 [Ooceraea biroi]|uniref:N-acetylgalactosamine kinase isoform X2 n=1 Tax=Ooceraea biroi TaxID=2015173 RepID=UPI0005BB379D|nr:N-acetylgalactosamine kinase isoform X2 [Ooceraea biroi]XP_026825700.1 N-acetylgalactosamine kinase-like isoform X2 [Ooceraea biroi]